MISRVIWGRNTIKHISKHHVTLEEVKEVSYSDALVLRGKKDNRLILVGSSEAGRILMVVLQPKGRGVFYLVTAYPASSDVASLYNRRKGGGK